jgi:hypothetical protein
MAIDCLGYVFGLGWVIYLKRKTCFIWWISKKDIYILCVFKINVIVLYERVYDFIRLVFQLRVQTSFYNARTYHLFYDLKALW